MRMAVAFQILQVPTLPNVLGIVRAPGAWLQFNPFGHGLGRGVGGREALGQEENRQGTKVSNVLGVWLEASTASCR